MLGLEELECSKDGTEHVACDAQVVVDGVSVDNPQEYEVRMNLIYFAGNFAQYVSHYTQYVVRIDLIDLVMLHKPVIVVYISANTFFYPLQLG